MAACRVVLGLELAKLPFKITAIPEQHLVEEFSTHRPNEALHEGVGQRYARHGFDFVDLQNPQIRHPTVRFEQQIVISTKMSRCTLPVNRRVEQTAKIGAGNGAAVDADADEATRELVHDDEYPVASGEAIATGNFLL